MELLHVYVDDEGDSHFGDIDLPLFEGDLTPPSPSGYTITEPLEASSVTFMRTPAGYRDEWHPVPEPLLAILLSGRLRMETSDGDARIIEPGQVLFHEDTWGNGHARPKSMAAATT